MIEESAQSSKKGASEPIRSPGASIAVSAAFIALGTLSSRILGLVRDGLMTALFGRTLTDAWLVAFRLPNMFRRLLGEGSLSVSFIPVFVGTFQEGAVGDGELPRPARELVDGVYSILTVVLVTLTLLGILYADVVLGWISSGEGFVGVPGKMELTVRLARIMFIYILLVSLYAYAMALLNAVKKFGKAAFAPALWNVAMIISTLLPQSWGQPGDTLAWGVVVGGVLQLGFLLPELRRLKLFPKWTWHWNTPQIKTVFKNMLPSLAGLGVLQATLLVNTHFASHLPEGTNTWIFLADRVLELPLALFALSLGSALLPTLSRYWSQGNREAMSQTAAQYLRLTLFLSLPSALGIWWLAKPTVEVLFQRGRFSAEDVHQTAVVLSIYSVAVVTYSIVRVLSPCYYAIRNTWYPAVSSGVSLAVHILLAPVWIEASGISGLIASTVTSGVVNMILLMGGYWYFVGQLNFAYIIKGVWKFFVAGAAMIGFLQLVQVGWLSLSSSVWIQAVLFIALVGAACAVYFGASYVLRVEEMQVVVGRLKLRLARTSR